MPLARLRFTVRRLMVAVAVAGLVIASMKSMERRREEFKRLYREHLADEIYMRCAQNSPIAKELIYCSQCYVCKIQACAHNTPGSPSHPTHPPEPK